MALSLTRKRLWGAGVALVVAATLAGCASGPSSTTTATPSKPRVERSVSLNPGGVWLGRYRAEAPCSAEYRGCTRQYMVLSVEPNFRYSLTTTVVRRDGNTYPVTSRARYRVDRDGVTIILASKDENLRLRPQSNDTLVSDGYDGLPSMQAPSLTFKRQ